MIENKFKESPFIEGIIVVGENRNFTSALIVPAFDHLESWCAVKGHEYTDPKGAITNNKIVNRIQREVDLANKDIDKTEQVKKFTLLSANFSVEDGELSPTLKLKRKVILEKYSTFIEEMYR